VVKASSTLRALMNSALLLLNHTVASEAVSTVRVWRSRSDLSCPQCRYTLRLGLERLGCHQAPGRLDNRVHSGLLVVGEERPDHPGVLRRSRDGGAGLSPSGDGRFQPPRAVVLCRVDPAEPGARAVHQQGAERALATLAHPEQPGLAARGVFARDAAEPDRRWAPIVAVGRIRHGSKDGGGCPWPKARHSLPPLTDRMRSSQRR
jgi:hypothetical protein